MSADAAFRALSEPNRREILRLVRDGARPAGEIAEHFSITQQAVSQHLKVLREAGLVTERRERTRRLYEVRPEGLAGVQQFLEELWPSRLGQLKQVVEAKSKRGRRGG